MRCIEIEQLLDVAQGRAEAAVANRIQTHLVSGCARCQDNWSWIQRIVHLAAADDSVEPPPWVLNQAIGLFEAYGPQRQPGRFQRLVASLVFDSLAQPQLVGVRQTGSAARQYIYRADDWDVDLSFEPGEEPETLDITGQVLKGEAVTEEITGIPVHLTQAGQILASTVTDRLGEFTFDHIARGTYDLSLELRDQQVWIEHLDVTLSDVG